MHQRGFLDRINRDPEAGVIQRETLELDSGNPAEVGWKEFKGKGRLLDGRYGRHQENKAF